MVMEDARITLVKAKCHVLPLDAVADGTHLSSVDLDLAEGLLVGLVVQPARTARIGLRPLVVFGWGFVLVGVFCLSGFACVLFPIIMLCFLSLMTWALRPHGVRTSSPFGFLLSLRRESKQKHKDGKALVTF